MSDVERGARPKDRSLRMKQQVDYKRMHEGTGHVDPTPDRIMRSGSQTVLGSSGGSPEEDIMGVERFQQLGQIWVTRVQRKCYMTWIAKSRSWRCQLGK